MRERVFALCAITGAVAGCGDQAPPSSERAPQPTPARSTTTAVAPVRTGGAPRVSVIARGLEVPWDISFLPDGRAFVTERPGRVRLVSLEGELSRAPVARVRTSARGEGGLLGIDLDPDFARGRRFAYLYVTTNRGLQVQRWRWTGTRLRRDGLVLGGITAGTIHDSGRLRFGPDRNLYVATGDAGRGTLSQNPRSRNGKILRLTPRQYRGRARSPQIFSRGHRNPQGLDWQPRSGRLFTSDHGPSGFDGRSGDDEINLVTRRSNHGWPAGRGRDHDGFVAPRRLYRRTIAPSGIAFVTRSGSAWTGDLLVAALVGRQLRRLELNGRRIVRESTLLNRRYGRLRAVAEAPDGTIWVTTSNRDTYGTPVSREDDRILRIVPPAG